MALGVQPYVGFQTGSGIAGLSKRRRLEIIKSSLQTEFQQHEGHLRDLAEYIKPRRPRWYTTDRNKGDRRNRNIIDSTGTFAARNLQAGLHSGMTNPARPWMNLTTPDPELAEIPSVRAYLHSVTQRMLSVFAHTNLYNSLPVHYGDMGVFGTAATGMLDDSEGLFRTYSYPIGSYAIATDIRGLTNQWVYETEKTVMEIVEEYLLNKQTQQIDWSKASTIVKTAWDNANYHLKVKVCWIITPNFMRDVRKLSAARSMPFYSCHFESGSDREDVFLREGGFEEFPILVSRWDVTGDDWWGTDCPGMVALGDIKQLQTGERRGLQAIEKQVYPSLKAPVSMRNQKTSLLPADVTYYDALQGADGPTTLHEVNLRVDHLEGKQASVRDRIRRAFYEDLFLMMSFSDSQRGAQPATATEVVERHEEKMVALGPVLERTNDELLDRGVNRAYKMMERANLLPEAPEELVGVDLRVNYTSILAQAQKLVNVVSQERFLTSTQNIAQTWPEARHKVNIFEAVNEIGEMLGVNPDVIVPNDAAQERMDQEEQAAQQAQQAEQIQQTAGAASDLAGANMEEDNALRRIVEGVV